MFLAGSLLSGGGSVPKPNATAEDWVNMVNEFQKAALSSRLGIPMIYGIDAVHGHNNVYKATIFPHNVGLGVTRQVSLSIDTLSRYIYINNKPLFEIQTLSLLFMLSLLSAHKVLSVSQEICVRIRV